ncbi:hypothetical protein [Streptomyces sp. V1I6]|uniref:hypothetical protein n=1 Tax=Streptomyces sp. V1I6 TaxID=3042273 RepID=UPI00278561AA|nr:hypothetical protein [Streptomyces sp. V1I6]MDQ0843618.1 hypothetical protein [Streptomyces sp. V1I6]
MSDPDVAANGKVAHWTHRASAHVAVLQGQLNRIAAMPGIATHDQELIKKANCLLVAAREAAEATPRLFGPAKDRALVSIHEAELILLETTPDEELTWWGPVVLAKGVQHLDGEDPRLRILEEHLRNNGNELGSKYRELAVGVLHAANHAEEWEISRVRGFRNALLLAFAIMSIIVSLFIGSGYWAPGALADKLCFGPQNPEKPDELLMVCPLEDGADTVVSPQGGDVLLVASLGAAAAALAGAVALHGIRGLAVPYLVPMSLLLLRIPIGALSAMLGLILIHGEFIPGLTALDHRGQIAAWAIAFGIGQEGLTRMLDKRGNTLMEGVRGSWPEGGSSPPPGVMSTQVKPRGDNSSGR